MISAPDRWICQCMLNGILELISHCRHAKMYFSCFLCFHNDLENHFSGISKCNLTTLKSQIWLKELNTMPLFKGGLRTVITPISNHQKLLFRPCFSTKIMHNNYTASILECFNHLKSMKTTLSDWISS